MVKTTKLYKIFPQFLSKPITYTAKTPKPYKLKQLNPEVIYYLE